MFRYILTGLLSPVLVYAQNQATQDTLIVNQLEEMIIISQKAVSDNAIKPLSSLDEYLNNHHSINMIKRGSYAWEPFLNGMASERSVITIDGMRIYSACTDKMDPVTSYVEITNLSGVGIHSDPSSSSGSAISGSIDMKRKKSTFSEKKFTGTVFTGWETNNQQKILGNSLSYSNNHIYTDIDFTYRHAKNYKAGGGEEVLYSQYSKYNVSAITGYKIDENQHLEASLIYDHATDVGYPALPMDVSLAKAFIGSLEYVSRELTPKIHQWETKLYFNDITHIMDDTKRPIVPIRMDMPGWSTTTGFYSLLMGSTGKHHWELKLSGHHNHSLAEMTMFSNNPNEKDMFMLTWPGVHTNYADVFVKDEFDLSNNWRFKWSAGMALHNNNIKNTFGFESLKIFYPHMEKSNTRYLPRLGISIDRMKNQWNASLSLAYGERAPSISEGYGFYLFNSFDRYDYVGNPNMKNEKTLSLQGKLNFKTSRFSAILSATNFYIKDYIIGQPNKDLSAMTIGAEGVKVYQQLDYANIFNISLELNYQFSENIFWTNQLSYRHGTGKKTAHLPLIQPLTFQSDLGFYLKTFSAHIGVNGAQRQQRFNPDFGERPLPGYLITNLSVGHRFNLGNHSLTAKAGAENLFDKFYTTFADWNRLPRMGRNLFVNVIFNF